METGLPNTGKPAFGGVVCPHVVPSVIYRVVHRLWVVVNGLFGAPTTVRSLKPANGRIPSKAEFAHAADDGLAAVRAGACEELDGEPVVVWHGQDVAQEPAGLVGEALVAEHGVVGTAIS